MPSCFTTFWSEGSGICLRGPLFLGPSTMFPLYPSQRPCLRQMFY